MKGLFLKHTFSTEKKLDLLKMSKPSPYWYLDNGVMEEKELKQVCRQLAAGEKRITLKEREFLFSKSKKKTERNSKKSFGQLMTIGRWPKLDGRSSSRALINIL